MFSISEEQNDRCLKSLGQVAETVQKDIQTIREWIHLQHHFPKFDFNASMIKSFLIRNKFNVESVKRCIESYFVSRGLIPEFFKNINPNLAVRQPVYKTNILVVLPTQTEEFDRVFWLRILQENAVNPLFILQEGINISELLIRADVFLRELIIIDMNNISFDDYFKVSPSFLIQALQLYRNVLKMRIKGVYIINCKSHISTILSIVKPLLKVKIFQRIYTDEGVECLQTLFSKNELPEDYGGKGPSLDHLNKMHRKEFSNHQKLFDELDELRINGDLRPERLKNDDVLGYYGHFKKLDVD